MPAALEYITDQNTPAARTLEEAFQKEQSARFQAHKHARKYYAGEHHTHLKRDGTGTQDNIIVNVIETLIDKSVSGMLGTDDRGLVKGVRFEVVNEPGEMGFMQRAVDSVRRAVSPETETPDQEQVFLDMVMRANRNHMLLLDALLDSALTGHGFIKLMPDGKEDIETGDALPRVVVLNPSNVTVFWAEDDVERVLWYRIEYENTRQDIVRVIDEDGADSGRWQILDYRRKTNMGRWELVKSVDWDYAWPPIVDWKNLPGGDHDYYGKSDVGVLADLNDSLNFTLSNTQRILKHHAHPKTIGVGVKAGEIEQTAVDGLWTVGSEDANLYNLEMQSDLSSSLNFANMLRRTIFDQGRELDPGSVQDKLGDITNFGLRVLFSDSLQKSAVKRLLAGEALVRLCRRLLELGGLNWRVRINVEWPDPLPTDILQTAQAMQIMAGLGLSNETALERAGFDPDQEQQRREVQRAERIEDETISSQNKLVNQLEAIGRGGFTNGRGLIPAEPTRRPIY